jgi:predicted lipoprotein with Yx(FWY)xxD motif
MQVLRPAGVALVLLACGSTQPSAPVSRSQSPSSVQASPAATSPTPSAQFALSVANSRYGKIIIDRSGRTLYLFDIESDRSPVCNGACALAWPPFLASGASGAAPSAPELDQALIATAVRNDGSLQLTYNGHPLYYYAGDHAAGEIKCQAVVEFGGGWYVIDAKGNKISTP